MCCYFFGWWCNAISLTLAHTGRQKSEKRSPTRGHFGFTIISRACVCVRWPIGKEWNRQWTHWRRRQRRSAALFYMSCLFLWQTLQTEHNPCCFAVVVVVCRHCCRRCRFLPLLICHANISWHFNFRIQLVFVTTHRCVNVQTHMCRRRIAIQSNKKKKRRRKKRSHFSFGISFCYFF